jgi:pilus assembly protein CpaC
VTHEDTMTIALPMKPRGHKMNWLRAATAIVLTALLAAPALAASMPYLRIPNRAAGAMQSVQVEVSKSMLVDLPTNAGEVIASDPNVANVIMRSKTRAIVQGKQGGSTNIFFLDPAGNNIAVLDVKVVQPASQIGVALESTLARVIPSSNIRVQTLSDTAIDGTTHFLLTGTVRTAEDKAVAEQMAGQLSGGEDEVGSLIQVVGPQQVMLKVTVAEIQRDVAKQLGVNFSSTFSVAGVSGTFNNGITPGATGGGSLNIPLPGGSGISGSIDVAVRALEERGALRTLATPTLTALSGQPATFLAGGELPYNRVVDGNVVTEFKPYGIELGFTPTIKSDGTISLVVDSSVSEPTGSQGAINKRDVTTTVVLGAGQTLSIAGLLSERARQDIDKLPGLGDIPILGALFRSREYRNERTELVFLVTPYYAWPEKGTPDLPTDHMEMAGDAEAIFLGHLEKMYGVGNDGMRGSYNGSVGFVLD